MPINSDNDDHYDTQMQSNDSLKDYIFIPIVPAIAVQWEDAGMSADGSILDHGDACHNGR